MLELYLTDDILKTLVTINGKNYLLSFNYYYDDDYERDHYYGILGPNQKTTVYEIQYPILDFHNGSLLMDDGNIMIYYGNNSYADIIKKPVLFKNAFIFDEYVYYTTRNGGVYYLDIENKPIKHLDNVDNATILRKNTCTNTPILKEYSKLYVPKKVFDIYNGNSYDPDSNDESYYIIYGSYKDSIATKDTLILFENGGLYTIYSRYKFFINEMYNKFPKLHNVHLSGNHLYILDNNKIHTMNTSNSLLDTLPINMQDEIVDFRTHGLSVFYKTSKDEYYAYSRARYNMFKNTEFFEEYDKDNYILKLNKEKIVTHSKKLSF